MIPEQYLDGQEHAWFQQRIVIVEQCAHPNRARDRVDSGIDAGDFPIE